MTVFFTYSKKKNNEYVHVHVYVIVLYSKLGNISNQYHFHGTTHIAQSIMDMVLSTLNI